MIELVVVTLSAVVSAVLGAWGGHHWTKRLERVQVTLDLYRKFYEPEMHRARVLGARTLLDESDAHTLDTLWIADETVPQYEALTQVVYFWFGLAELAKVKMVDRDLARRFFAYPFAYWKPLLERMVGDTLAEGSSPEDWVIVIRDQNLEWLLDR